MYSRNSRSMSAGELRELYGISVRQLRSSEAVFRKEAFKRDKQRLKVLVQAIDNEMKLAQHTWDSARSKFVRDHAEFVFPERSRVVYHKIGRVHAQPAEFVPPCIPVVGDCPQHGHVMQGVRVGDRRREVLARHSAHHHHHHHRPLGLDLTEEERRRSLDNDHHVLVNRRVSNACRPASVRLSAVSSSASHGTFSPKSGAFSPTPSRCGDLSHRSSHGKGVAPCQLMCEKHSHHHLIHSLAAADNGQLLNAGMDEYFPADRENNHRIANPYQHSDMNNNNNGIHTDTGCAAEVDNSNTPLVTNTRYHQKSLNTITGGGHTEEKPDRETAASHHHQTEKTTARDSRQKKKDDSRESTDRDSSIAPSGSDSAESLDVELLLRALTEQCAEILAKNKWYRAVEKALLLPPGDSDDPDLQLPWEEEEPAVRHRLSIGSLSSSTLRAVANISDNNNDVDKAVIQMVLQVFTELDQGQFANLTEDWAAIMDKLMLVLKDLIRHTGTEVAEAVEKILKNDAKDKKYGVLFDRIKNVSSTDGEQTLQKTLSQQSCGQKVTTASNLRLTMDRSGKTLGAEHSQENIATQSLPKPPIIVVVPPSRRQSKETVRRPEYPFHRSEKPVQIETVTSISFGNDPSVRQHPSTSSSHGPFMYHTEHETHEQRKSISFYQKPPKIVRRLSLNIESISGITNKAKHLQSQEDECLAPEQRQRSFSYSRLHSAESHHSQTLRPRVNSTGQQGRHKPLHHDPMSVRRPSRKTTSARSPSPPSKAKRQGHSKTRNSTEQNTTSEAEEEAPKQQPLETTETSLYTDRMGKTHLLTTRKASLSWACTREANVTVTRDDTVEEKNVLPTEEKNTDEAHPPSPWACSEEAITARPEHPSSNSPHPTEEEEEETGRRHPPDTRHGAASPAFSLRSFPAEKSQQEEEDSQSLHNHDRDTPDLTHPAGREGPQDEGEALWRKRLSNPQELTWASELSSDLKGQGLALFLLYHKEGNSVKFRSVLLKVICINVLRAANEVYDDVLICDVKKCRYLRMPQGSMSGSQRELDLEEIFS